MIRAGLDAALAHPLAAGLIVAGFVAIVGGLVDLGRRVRKVESSTEVLVSQVTHLRSEDERVNAALRDHMDREERWHQESEAHRRADMDRLWSALDDLRHRSRDLPGA